MEAEDVGFVAGVLMWTVGGMGFPAWFLFAGGPWWCALAGIGSMVIGGILVACSR